LVPELADGEADAELPLADEEEEEDELQPAAAAASTRQAMPTDADRKRSIPRH
jgi:hypothetical protein